MVKFTEAQQRALAAAQTRLTVFNEAQQRAIEAAKARLASKNPELSTRQKQIDEEIARRQARIAKDQAKVESLSRPAGFFDLLTQSEEETRTDTRKGAEGFKGRIAENEQRIRELQAEAKYMAEKGKAVPKLDKSGRVREALKAVPASAIRSTSQIAGAAGIFGEGGERFAKGVEGLGQRAVEGLGLTPSEEVQFDPTQRLINEGTGAFGSIAPYIASEVGFRGLGRVAEVLGSARAAQLAQRAGTGTNLGLGSGQGASQARETADEFERRTGQKLTPAQRSALQAGGATIGLTEALPIPGLVRRAPPGSGSVVERMVSGALGEGAQEAGTQFGQNILAATYDPDQEIGEDVLKSGLLGGLVGTGVRGATEAVSALSARKGAPQGAVPPQAGEVQPGVPAQEQGPPPLASLEIRVPDRLDPNKITRQKVDVLSAPDEKGVVSARREDGRLFKVPLQTLESMRVPEEGYGAFVPPDMFTREIIAERLNGPIEGTTDRKIPALRDAVARKVENDLALGKPDDAITYINSQIKRVTKQKTSPEGREARLNLLEEAKSVVNDYRVEYARTQAQPGIKLEGPQAPVTPTLEDLIAQNQAMREQEEAARAAEAARLAEIKLESDLETASSTGQQSIARQQKRTREEIISPILEERTIDPANRIRKTNAALERAGFNPMSREELTTLYGREAAFEVFGEPIDWRGEIDRILADDTIKDKYRAYAELADENPDVPDLSAQEFEEMRGDAAPLEGMIKAAPVQPERGVTNVEQIEEPVEQVAPTGEPEVGLGPEPSMPAGRVQEQPGGVDGLGSGAGVPDVGGADTDGTVTGEPETVERMALEPDGDVAGAPDGGQAGGEPALGGVQTETAEPSVQGTVQPPTMLTPPEGEVDPDSPAAFVEQVPSSPNRPKLSSLESLARLKEAGKKYWSGFVRKFSDRYRDALDYDRWYASAFGVEQIPDDMSLQQAIKPFASKRGGRQQSLYVNYLRPIQEKIAQLKLDPQDVGMFLWARAAPARNAMVREVSAKFPEGGSGLDDAQAQAVLAHYALSGQLPELEQLAAMHDQLVDFMLNERVRAGLIDREEANRLRREQPFYTPLKGFAEAGDMLDPGEPDPHSDDSKGKATAKRKGIGPAEYIKARGRISMPFNPLYNLFHDAEMLFNRIETNEVGRRMLRNIQEDPESHAEVARVYTDAEPKYETVEQEGNPEGITRALDMTRDSRNNPGKYLVVKDGGITHYIEFASTDGGQALARMFNNMKPEQAEGLWRQMMAFGRIIKSFVTRLSPNYLLGTAPFRDIQDGVATAVEAQNVKGGPAFGKNLAKRVAKLSVSPENWGSIWRYMSGREPKTDSQAEVMLLIDQMLEDGGGVAHAMFRTAEDFAAQARNKIRRQKILGRADPSIIPEVMDDIMQIVDLVPRLATYRAALEAGLTRQQAADLALDSSLDLTRRGEWSEKMEVFQPFISPAIESSRKLIRIAKNPRAAAKIFGAMMALGAAQMLVNYLMAGDDDEDGIPDYKSVPKFTRMTRLYLYTGDDKGDPDLSIPMGFMLAYPKYVGETIMGAALDMADGRDAAATIMEAGSELAKGLASQLSPARIYGGDVGDAIRAFAPLIAKPFADLAANQNFFGGEIYRDARFDENTPRSEMGRQNTAEFWKSIAKGLNTFGGGTEVISGDIGGIRTDYQPERFRYIFESWAGGPWKFVEDSYNLVANEPVGDEPMEKIPVLKGFTGRGFEYYQRNLYEDTVKKAQMPKLLKARETAKPEVWAKEVQRDPLNTDNEVLSRYRSAESKMTQIYKSRKSALANVEDPNKRKAITDFYQNQLNQTMKNFNRMYHAKQREYEKK